ncbi:C2H2 finger domain-containing protein [Diaporthe helianthi]|uniref:C2H2 finger domain-containing protein n=1 Tax=Diaporthe helianthi TaxID=158607 RepID=A0A2P5HH02_DIAHE|nr:C2H2 finger domain-containing protein [Diaporthe helianthi]
MPRTRQQRRLRGSGVGPTTSARLLPARSAERTTQLNTLDAESNDSDESVSDFVPDNSDVEDATSSKAGLVSDEDSDAGLGAHGEVTDDNVNDLEMAKAGKNATQLELMEMEEQVSATSLEFIRGTSIISNNDDVNDPEDLFDGNVPPVEYYREQLQKTNPNNFRRKEYAHGTEKLVANTETQWHLFCTKILRKKDPARCFHSLNFQMVSQFLNWTSLDPKYEPRQQGRLAGEHDFPA